MLTDLLFGSYRKKVLSQLLLHPDQDYHVRELARLTGTAPGTLHKELARLAIAGLLKRKALGNQVRYQANRECPVFPELAGATLDVFEQEPLPADHAFWRHPKSTVTPHASARTLREESIAQIAAKIRKVEARSEERRVGKECV